MYKKFLTIWYRNGNIMYSLSASTTTHVHIYIHSFTHSFTLPTHPSVHPPIHPVHWPVGWSLSFSRWFLCPGTHSSDQVGLEFRDLLPLSPSLGIRLCTIMLSCFNNFKLMTN